jgi:predicted transcriptional regulator YheO
LLQIGNQLQSLFINDWQEKLHVSTHAYLQNHNLLLDHLSQSDKKALAKHLFDLGVFHEKNAAVFVLCGKDPFAPTDSQASSIW